ncbi:MAG: hypothetical protein ABI969_12380 [bacterium]
MLIPMALLLSSARLEAQVTSPTQPLPVLVLDSQPPFERPNGALLRPGTLVYTLALTKPNGETAPLGTRTVVVSESNLGGNPGWLIAEERTGTVVRSMDSVYVTRSDLRPARWNGAIGRAQIGASFTTDSVFGAAQSYQGRASFSAAVPANVLLSAGMTERVLELLPIRDGYRAAASLLLIDGAAPRIIPAEIAVNGSEAVSIGGRSVDAWRVTLRWGVKEERLWISRDEMRVVKTEQVVPEGVFVATLK